MANILSKDIKVYPSAWRGNVNVEGTDKLYNPESRLFTEENAVRPFLKLADNDQGTFIITTETDQKPFEFVINGYHFEINKTLEEIFEAAALSNPTEFYAYAIVTDTNSWDENNCQFRARLLRPSDGSSDSTLDDANGDFIGLGFAKSSDVVANAKFLLLYKEVDGEWIIPDESLLKYKASSINGGDNKPLNKYLKTKKIDTDDFVTKTLTTNNETVNNTAVINEAQIETITNVPGEALNIISSQPIYIEATEEGIRIVNTPLSFVDYTGASKLTIDLDDPYGQIVRVAGSANIEDDIWTTNVYANNAINTKKLIINANGNLETKTGSTVTLTNTSLSAKNASNNTFFSFDNANEKVTIKNLDVSDKISVQNLTLSQTLNAKNLITKTFNSYPPVVNSAADVGYYRTYKVKSGRTGILSTDTWEKIPTDFTILGWSVSLVYGRQNDGFTTDRRIDASGSNITIDGKSLKWTDSQGKSRYYSLDGYHDNTYLAAPVVMVARDGKALFIGADYTQAQYSYVIYGYTNNS